MSDFVERESRGGLLKTAAIGLVGIALMASSASAATRLKVAGQHAPDHNATLQLNEIKKEVEGAGVDLKLQLFPSGQLGTGEQVFGDVSKGVIDIGHTFIYSHNDPLLEINTIPYLVDSYGQMRKVFTPGSNFYRVYSDLLAKQGIRLLGIFGEGFIGVGASKKPADATGFGKKNMTIRVWSAAVAKETASDMGFNTTTIDWGDVYPALQQGVVDGVIGGTPEANYTTFRDAIKYYIPYNPFVENTAYYMSQKSWDKLSADQQKVIEQAFGNAALKSFEASEATDKEFMGKLGDSGIEVIALTDAERSAIADHIRATTWPKLEQAFGKDLMDQLKADVQ